MTAAPPPAPGYQVPPGWVWEASTGWWAPKGLTPDGRRLAGFGKRFLGWLVDLLITMAPLALLLVFFLVAVVGSSSSADSDTAGAGVSIAFSLFFLGILALYVGIPVLEAELVHRRGRTWGMGVVGLRVIDARTGGQVSRGKAYGRTLFGRFISAQIYIGYLWPLWDDRNRTLHDLVCGTVVVEE